MASSPRNINFYHLPRPVQERFAATTRRKAPPAPLLFAPASRRAAWISLAAAAVLTVVTVLVLRAGWGDVASPLALHSGKMVLVDGALVAGAAYGVVHAAGLLYALDRLPWRPGRYLFPLSIIDATRARMRVWEISDPGALEKVTGPEAGLALKLADGTRVVVPASPSVADKAREAIAALRERNAQGIADEDAHVLAELDPLHDRALSSPIGPQESMRASVPLAKRLDWLLALLIGAAVGPALAAMRDKSSDEAMYAQVLQAQTVQGFQQYLVRGGQHSDDVREVLLPRAELREARAAGTVEAIQAFAASHPNSKIGPEVDAALRHAMLVELDKAKSAGTVTALDELAHKYPDNRIGPELSTARHALFAAALDAWHQSAKPDAAVDAFMRRLVAWAEQHGPACTVRFRLTPSKSLEAADHSVQSSDKYPGVDAIPSRWVSAAALRRYEDGVSGLLSDGFAKVFPADILSVKAAEPLAPDAPDPTDAPVLLIDYSPEWARGNTLNPKPLTIFAGWIFAFATKFTVPGGVPPLATTVRSWRGAEIWKFKADMGLPREEYEAKVYDSMMSGAFDQLGRRLKSWLL